MSSLLNSFTPILPHELWHEIFQFATFLPDELEIPTTMIRPGLFGAWDEQQPSAWKIILPLRVAIQSVSRLWHSIGIELLYRAFHNTDDNPTKIKLFARTLCIKLSYAVLVKRLTLPVTIDDTINASTISILRSCPNLLIFSTHFETYKPQMGWELYLLPTSLRHFDAAIDTVKSSLSDLFDFAALAHFPNLEFLALHGMSEGRDAPPPVFARSIVLPRLRFLRLDWHSISTIEKILSSLSLPSLTALSLDIGGTLLAPTLRKDLLSRLTYLGLGRSFQGTLVGSFQATDLPRLHIFQLDMRLQFERTLLFECPNLPIQQIDILVLSLYHFEADEFPEWSSSLYGLLTEARDSKLTPKLKRVILKEKDEPFFWLSLSYEDLISCFNSLVDAFESRGVEFLFRPNDIWEGDVSIRDFVAQMEIPLLSSYTRTLLLH
jgi:hypothetical protein